MARIRTIKPEFFTSDDIVSMTPLARLFYVSLWCEADREGRFSWNTRTLKRRYLSGDDVDVDMLAGELTDANLIEIYEVDGRLYAEILSFKNHQVINNREAESVLPSRVKVASRRVQGEGRKEGKERKEGTESVDSLFDMFYEAYPRKVGKPAAVKAFAKCKADEALVDQMIEAIEQQKKTPQWSKDEGQYIPHPASWLNNERWCDTLDAQSATPSLLAGGI
jgi:hypothetical protein